jgi:hypothetical protein
MYLKTLRCLYYVSIPAGQTVTVSVQDLALDCPYDPFQILMGSTTNINLCSSTQRQFSFNGGTTGGDFSFQLLKSLFFYYFISAGTNLMFAFSSGQYVTARGFRVLIYLGSSTPQTTALPPTTLIPTAPGFVSPQWLITLT